MRVIQGCSNPQPEAAWQPLFFNPPDWLVGWLVHTDSMSFRHCRSSPLPGNTRANDLSPPALYIAVHRHTTQCRKLARVALSSEFAPSIQPLPPLPLLPISLASPDFTHSHGRHFKYLTPQLLDDDDNIDKARTAEFSYSQTCFESIVGQFCHLSDNSSVLQRVPFNCFRPLLIIYPDVYDLLITISRHIFFTFLSPFCGWLSLF